MEYPIRTFVKYLSIEDFAFIIYNITYCNKKVGLIYYGFRN